MNSKLGVVGWVLAVVFAVGAVCLFAYEQNVAAQLAEAKAQAEGLQAQLDGLKGTIAAKDAAITGLEDKIASLEKAGAAPGVDGLTANGADVAEAIKKMMGGGGEDGESDGPLGAFGGMFEGESGKAVASMSVNMAYGDLFTELGLPADIEEKVRDILSSNIAGQMSEGMKGLNDGVSPAELKKMEDEAEANMRTDLSAILNEEEMAIFDEYQATVDERMLGQGLDMQLGMFASGLTGENRALVRDVMVDEFLALDTGMRDGSVSFDAESGPMGIQQQALAKARERLAQELDEEQLAHVDRYIQQMQQMAEMAMQFMKPKDN